MSSVIIMSFGIVPFILFGLWWILFPGSVLTFYEWIYARDLSGTKIPGPQVIRALGAAWLLAVLFFAWRG
jgi:hypothetical protein